MLGPLRVHDGRQWQTLRAAKQRSLLAVLLASANEVVSREQLIDEVWRQRPPRTANNVLQGYVSRLRQITPADDLCLVGTGYRLLVRAGDLDIQVFEERAAAGHQALADGDPHAARAALTEALAMWRGTPLSDVSPGPLVEAEAGRLLRRRHAVLLGRITADLAVGRHAETLAELEQLVAESPLDEQLHEQLMIALYRSGRPAAALDCYERIRRSLSANLGLDPSPSLTQLQRRVLERDPALEVPGAVGVSGLRTTRPRPSELPADIPDFVGRSRASAELVGHLTAPRRAGGVPPIVVISGDPGIGKSTLALHVAHQARGEYPDGHLYVDLGAAAEPLEPADLLGRLLRGVGVEPREVPETPAERAALLRSLMSGRSMLIVLDNAAHERQVRSSLPSDPRCGVIITSRRALTGLAGAMSLTLQPFRPEESVELLAGIAGAERVAGECVQAARIAQLCDGLPLALRIAGGRLAGRPHRGIAWLADLLADERKRLNELVVGDMAVRSSLDLSYHSLDPQDRAVVRMLGLLRAPDFAPWLAAALLDISVTEAEERLERLVEARLLDLATPWRPDAPRYRFHRLIRIYAEERAVSEEPLAIRKPALGRAFGACLAVAERLDRRLRYRQAKLGWGDGQREWVAGLDLYELLRDPLGWFGAERDVLTSVVRHASDEGFHDLAWDLATCLDTYLDLTGRLSEWQRIQQAALAATRAGGHRRGAACVLRSLGEIALRRDRYAEALRYMAEAAEIFGALDDEPAQAHVLLSQSGVHWHLGQLSEAAATAATAAAVFERTGDADAHGHALCSLASAHRIQGDAEQALDGYSRALAVFDRTGNRLGRAFALCGQGLACQLMGQFSESERLLEAALALCREAGHRLFEGMARCYLGELHLAAGRLSIAADHLEAGLSHCREMGERYGQTLALRALGETDRRRGDLARSAIRLAAAVELAREVGAPLLLARTLATQAGTAAAADDLKRRFDLEPVLE